MSMYGYYGGNPPEPLIDDEYWEYLGEHHECYACQETFHETELHRTNNGWCCYGCYDYLHTECVGHPDLPEIL